MSDNVQYFIFNFCQTIKEGLLPDIQNMYENTFPQLTDHYFDSNTWPEWKEISDLVDNDKEFSILYKELYFRHIHSRVQGGPTLSERVGSFYNYCDFFNMLLTARKPIQLTLPDVWLWELVDEFIYQFQNFSCYRSCLSDKTEDELKELCLNQSNEWSILCVLNVLHSLIEISDIRLQMKVTAEGLNPMAVAGEYGRLSLYKMLGYFSIVGLARVHAQLGDYFQVIKVLEPLGVQKILEYAPIPGCRVSLCYYVGFAFMMMRRYVDAITVLSEGWLYAQSIKQPFSAHSHRNEQIKKQTDQMFYLLAICMVLQPQRIDESLQQKLRDKNCQDAIIRMQSGDLEVFETFFVMACPQFLSACPPPANAAMRDYGQFPLEQQLTVFLSEVRQQIKIPTLRSYLKLYTTLPVSKLTSLMSSQGEQKSEKDVLTDLLCFKHKMHNTVRTATLKDLDGKLASVGELDFYVDDNMIHVVDTEITHSYNDFFLNKILQLNEVNRKLSKLKFQ